jgi:hypothetical protein
VGGVRVQAPQSVGGQGIDVWRWDVLAPVETPTSPYPKSSAKMTMIFGGTARVLARAVACGKKAILGFPDRRQMVCQCVNEPTYQVNCGVPLNPAVALTESVDAAVSSGEIYRNLAARRD